jgi:large subunit ribosomal protein L23
MASDLSKIILGQHITEKSSRVLSENQYVFKVHRLADKFLVKKAVEKNFNVKVAAVNILNILGKTKRSGRFVGKKSDWKKAYVTLQQGYSINLESETSKGG